jgi:hypothetical protein
MSIVGAAGWALLAAVVVTLLYIVPFAASIEESWNIVVVSHLLAEARVIFTPVLSHALDVC